MLPANAANSAKQMTYKKQDCYYQREIYDICNKLYVSFTIYHNDGCLADTETPESTMRNLPSLFMKSQKF